MFNLAEEIYFWTGIMRDHGEFQIEAFSPREIEFAKRSLHFKKTFSDLHNEVRELMDQSALPTDTLNSLAERIIPIVLEFIKYKEFLMRQLLECNIEFTLTPSFVNHMVNEANEFYRVLTMDQAPEQHNPTAETLHLHLIWLRDASGHAGAIAARLDDVESMLIKEAQRFKKKFDNLFLKAYEMNQMLKRTDKRDGALKRLDDEVDKTMRKFIDYLDEARIGRKLCNILGVFKPLVPDHMIREERYYLMKFNALKNSL